MAHFGRDLDNFSAARTVQITNRETNEHFTIYTIEVTVGTYSWTVKHRYSEFHDLHEKLVVGYKLDKTLLPPKKMFGNHTDSFIKKRQQELQVYLQTVLLYLAHHPPPALTFFLDFHLYEIHGITQALAEDLYNRGEMILQSKEVYQMTPLQLYSLTERLKLPEPTCDSGDVRKDLGHILDFITRTKHLQICGSNDRVGHSNINMNQLKFDLSLFKSLQSLEVITCNFQMVQGLETIKQTLQCFNVYCSAASIKEVVLPDLPQWKSEDGTQIVPGWDNVTHLDFSHNFIREIDQSVQMVWRAEQVNLSHNRLEGVQHLQWLSHMTHLDLSHNRLCVLDSLHTKLGNLKCLLLTANLIQSLQGFSKLFSLQILDVSDNKIAKVEDIEPVCRLPCLEKLQLSGNPVATAVDYRTKVLVMFADRVDEVTLDNQRTSQQEKDTVAVRQALQKARETKPRQAPPRKNCSSLASNLRDTCQSLPSTTAAATITSDISQSGEDKPAPSTSLPHHPLPHRPSVPDLRETHRPSSGSIFVPGCNSSSQTSVWSCMSAQEVITGGAEVPTPIPEAHPFDHSADSVLAVPPVRKEYNAADLLTMASLDFVSWLENHLLNDDSLSKTPLPSHSTQHPHNRIIPAGRDQVMDIMWCYAQQYSSSGVVFPCCAVLTSTKVIIERLVGTTTTGSPMGCEGMPELRPCVVLPLTNIQHAVLGPGHAYLRLEEAFVGKGGLCTIFALDPQLLKCFVNTLNGCCQEADVSSPLNLLDMSLQSDLLTEIGHREESLGLPSHRLAFTHFIKMKDREQFRWCILILSENKVYCLDPECVYWPPPTFQPIHEGAIHLKVLKEFSIIEDIMDVSLHTPHTYDRENGAHYRVDFTSISLTIQVKTAAHIGQLVFLFTTCCSRDSFLDRLTNLRTEHAHRMSPSVRQAPEGGNESVVQVDSSVPSHGTCPPRPAGGTVVPQKQTQPGPGNESQNDPKDSHVQLPHKDISPVSAGMETVVPQKQAQPLPPRVSITNPGSSLPSSFDWKGYYFNDTPSAITKVLAETNGNSRAERKEGQYEAEIPNRTVLADTQSSGEVEEDVPTPFEAELRQAVRAYHLLQAMPSRLRPVSLMSGREVIAFFCSKVAGSPSSAELKTPVPVAAPTATGGAEELRHVMWTTVVPYTDPSRELVTLVMLSTRAVYLVSDSSTNTSASSARPSWMTHGRHKSDSAVEWQSKSPTPNKGSRQGGRWSKVKPFAVLALSELMQVSVGLFDQFLRLTGPTAQTVFTLATRDPRLTSIFMDRLKTSLSLMVSSPVCDKSPTDMEQDFYHAFAKRTSSTVDGLVYTHPSKVIFLYPGDDAIDDILFLIKAKIQAFSSRDSQLHSVSEPRKDVVWLYLLAYQLLPPFMESVAAVPPDRIQTRSVIITSHHLCLAREDIVTYPLPDFVRGLPEQPQHEVLETRRLDSLKRIVLSRSNAHTLCLVFWDEPEELVVDTNMEHFGQVSGVGMSDKGGKVGGRKIVPEVVIKLFIQNQRDSDKLVETLQKQWRQLVPQVGRILDVVRE